MTRKGTMALHNVLYSFKRLKWPSLNAYNECCVSAFLIQYRCYAKKAAIKGKGKGMVKEVIKGPEICKDPVKLCTHAVGVNIFKQGEDPPLKPKEEYPEWLFQLDLGPTKKLNELDPDSREYWKLLRKEHIWRHNKLHKGKKM
ncbi:39S ribosomal protein L54, mitochondrial-like [Myxocyprinus asiaticus]|uniref:39S ribosomal protein L54, mitochondrial-like n=1 Tax=Myxocyprinus asiaticus TaxID=70543 RepID=UPI002221B3E2|nr:39S ribosomal protein L54, mitochondrial-like [Myxocyprinus asiaticus]